MASDHLWIASPRAGRSLGPFTAARCVSGDGYLARATMSKEAEAIASGYPLRPAKVALKNDSRTTTSDAGQIGPGRYPARYSAK